MRGRGVVVGVKAFVGVVVGVVGLGVVALGFVVLGAVVGVWVAPAGGDSGSVEGRWVSAVEEDDPRWDCESMGNGVCGPGVELVDSSYVRWM